MSATLHGAQLYSLLPEVYRERDPAKAGGERHLEAYLDAHGALLDRARDLLEQLYADHFAETADTGRTCQSWVIPYLAALVGAEPVSPFAEGRREETRNAVRWAKRKGTLTAIAELAESLALAEVEIHEGWRRVATTVRLNEPLLPSESFAHLPHPTDAILASADPFAPVTRIHPMMVALHPGMPGGTVHFAWHSRAVRDDIGEPGVSVSRFGGARLWPRDDESAPPARPAPVGWRMANLHGVPCFPDSYEDISRRTVDVRLPRPGSLQGRFHPKALIIHLPPPIGFCSDGPFRTPWPTAADWADASQPFHPHLVRETSAESVVYGNPTGGSVVIDGDVEIGPGRRIDVPAGTVLRLEKLRFDGKVTVTGGEVSFERCAIRTLTLAPADTAKPPQISLKSVLVDAIRGGPGALVLEYVTVLSSADTTASILASEAILPDDVSEQSLLCARYSRLPQAILDKDLPGRRRALNTAATPLYVSAAFCTPGAGVLRADCETSLLNGAEDGGEMGAYHDWGHHAVCAALLRKLEGALPMQMRAVIVWDPRLLIPPPRLGP